MGIGTVSPTEKLQVEGNILLGGTGATYRLRNVADPLVDTDVSTKGYTDTAVENRLPSGAIALFADPNGRDGWTYLGDAYQKIQDWNISRAVMPVARAYAASATANNKIYVIG